MILEFSEEQLLFRHEVERFLSKEYGFDRRKKSVAHTDGCDPEIWANLAELGVLALPFLEDVGGLGAGPVELGLVMEAFGKYLVIEPYIAAVLAGGVIARAGNAEQQAHHLPPLIGGESRAALAHDEVSGKIGTRASRIAGGWRLDGAKMLVLGGPGSDTFVVSARDESNRLRLFLVPAEASGLTARPYRLADGGRASDLALTRVDVGADAELTGGDAKDALEQARQSAILGLCWEAVGAMRAALEQTADYVKQRRQFGRPIAAFQVVQHKLAEMAVCCEEAHAAARLAASAPGGDARGLTRVISGAKAKIGKCARLVAKEAVQLHGGMGVSEELPIASYFRKLLAFETLLGSTAGHLERYASEIVVPGIHKLSAVLPPMTNAEERAPDRPGTLALSAEENAFRAEIRRFLDEKLTPEMKEGQGLSAGVFPEPEVSQPWHGELFAKGWVASLWPVEYGGTGWTGIERFIFENESALAGAPLAYPMGVRLVAPVIIAFGTEAQKQFYLPKILSGEDYWCQGFSEPGSGSDLASLSTRAEPDGDDYIVNGGKIWTTHAHHSNRMITLVRTGNTERRQDGISALIIDLDMPGVEIRPIISIGGEHDVNQVFLTDVRVPRANRIGEENMGWSYAKYLLEFERGGGLVSSRLRSNLKRIDRAMDALATKGYRARDNAGLMARLAEVAIDVDTFEMLELKTLGPLKPGENPGPISSVLKLRASRLKQTIGEIGVEILGADGVRWNTAHESVLDVLLPDYLNSRAATIFGGASEVQLGIIAKSLVGV